jgi:nucleoside-diphosphate-sugar epimerase
MHYESCIIIGIDTFIGSHLAKAMVAAGYGVMGLGGRNTPALPDAISYTTTDYLHYDLPADCPLVLFCHDVALDRDLHVKALSALCEHLAEIHSQNRQVHLAYFSSTNICNANGHRISEESEVFPHCLRDAAVAHAEMIMKTWCSLSRNAISPHIFRYGELYGEEDGFPTPAGHVNDCLARARQGESLVFYGNLNQKRTLTHIDDFATAVAEVLRHGLTPSRVNIPGEHLMVVDFLEGISGHYGVDWEPTANRPAVVDENVPFASSDRLLNAAVFKSIVPDFKPKHKFANWLQRQPIGNA